ncbi:HVA22-like protein a isoform X1 [Bidens hawaiensis]|uniref:HVA22-like protein a isoform X1 n=1 Tax=Bidens hawaiensis TaxID=980011 RepID=UPI00404B8601
MGKSGVAAGDLLVLLAQNFDVLAGPVISLAYPLYASIRAIETKNVSDDQQWLTYWVLYSMITLFELTFATLIEWIPFWSYAKLIITCWLVIPQFSGAAYVYQHYIRPFYVGDRTINVFYVPPSKKDTFTDPTVPPSKKVMFTDPMQEDVVVSADKYVRENGPYAFSSYGYMPESQPQEIFHRGFQSDIDGEAKYRGNSFFSEDDYGY